MHLNDPSRENHRPRASKPTSRSADSVAMVPQGQVDQHLLEEEIAQLRGENDELAAQLAHYRDLYELSPIGFMTIDSDGVLVESNLAGAALLRHDCADLLGKRLHDFISERDWLTFDTLLREGFQTRTQQSCELTLLSDGYPPRIVKMEAGFGVGQQGCRAVVLDVTQRRRLERQSQKMEAVGQLAGGVAHDFNNLLTIILGACDVLLDDNSLCDETRKLADEIQEAGSRAAALTGQLLAFSRQQIIQPQVLNLNEVAHNISKMITRLIGDSVVLTTALPSKLWAVQVDKGLIEQVLVNLAVNARDAMPQGGRLTIETANVELTEEVVSAHWQVKPGRYVMLAVGDTGCGMSEATQAHLFEPFFTTKEPGEGTGLGLVTVLSVTKQFGGHVTFDSDPASGTTFRIYLPMVAETIGVGASVVAKPVAARGTETLLVVEDDNAVRFLVCHILRAKGYVVLEAPGGVDALLVHDRHPGEIKLVLTDVTMPQMSGRKLSEQLLARQPDLKLLFMSGYSDDTEFRQGVLEGETNFIQKPFTASALANKIRSVLDHVA